VETNFQQRFIVNVWCGIIDDQVIGSFILEYRLIGQSYLAFLQNELTELLEDVPLATRVGMYFQHDETTTRFSRAVIHINNTSPGRWIGFDGPHNWPPRSPDLSSMDYGLWGWMKSQVNEIKVNT
jgi:hypothetical protein